MNTGAKSTHLFFQRPWGEIRDDKSKWVVSVPYGVIRHIPHNIPGLWVTNGPYEQLPTGWSFLRFSSGILEPILKELKQRKIQGIPVVFDFRYERLISTSPEIGYFLIANNCDVYAVTYDIDYVGARANLGVPGSTPSVVQGRVARLSEAPIDKLQELHTDADAFSTLVHRFDAVAKIRVNKLKQVIKYWFDRHEKRLILVGTNQSATSVFNIMARDYGPGKPQDPLCRSHLRVAECLEDITWFFKGRKHRDLIVPVDVIGTETKTMRAMFCYERSRRRHLTPILVPPTTQCGAALFRRLVKSAYPKLWLGWGKPDYLFLRWRRHSLLNEGALSVYNKIREIQHV